MPRVDAIGGSSAGFTLITARWWLPCSAEFHRKNSRDQKYVFAHPREMGVPLEVINDGDVTALAGSMSIEDNAVLGIALGSSEAAGYVNAKVTSWAG